MLEWKDVLTPFGTVTAALVAAYLGSLQGARVALARFKQERGFDRRLTSYEQVATAFGDAKTALEVARTFQEDPSESDETKWKVWKNVQDKYLALVVAENVAVIYAGNAVYQNLRSVRESFDMVADNTNGMDPADLRARPAEAYPLIDQLFDAIQEHSSAVRAELGFEPIETPSDAGGQDVPE
jgi:hypothetical protein